MLRARPWLLPTLACAVGCVVTEHDEPGGVAVAITPGVYRVDVAIQDGCRILQLPAGSLDCEGGLVQNPDGSLDAFWPQPWNSAYFVHRDALPRDVDGSVQRFTALAREQVVGCMQAEHLGFVQIATAGEGRLVGGLAESWTGLAECPFGTQAPPQDCTIAWSYRYELVEPCEDPCELVEGAGGDPSAPNDCGARACRCP
jgi:hypothetical protein